MRFATQLYPYPLQPVDLVVEQHLGVGQVDVAVVGIIQQMPEQSEVVPSVLGSLLGCALVAKHIFKKILKYLEAQSDFTFSQLA